VISWMLGAGISGFQVTLDHGLRPGISVDNETSSTALICSPRCASVASGKRLEFGVALSPVA
jgi:hypothetical protein